MPGEHRQFQQTSYKEIICGNLLYEGGYIEDDRKNGKGDSAKAGKNIRN